MRNTRSFCAACRKEMGHRDFISVEIAVFHSENNPTHHVIINPVLEKVDQEEQCAKN